MADQLKKKSLHRLQLYKKPFYERVTQIRSAKRNGELVKYKPRIKREKLEEMRERRRLGRPPLLMPPYRISTEFKQIQKMFIEPLINSPHWPEDMSVRDRIYAIFHVHTRDIVPAIVNTDIKMPGRVIDTNYISKYRMPVNQEALFPKGTPIFVRLDDTMPDRIDIENCEKPDLIFSLTKDEYKSIINKIEEINGCDYRLDPPGEVRQADGSFTDLT